MKKVNVYNLPLAFNICNQMLCELEKIPVWTMAPVPPKATLPLSTSVTFAGKWRHFQNSVSKG